MKRRICMLLCIVLLTSVIPFAPTLAAGCESARAVTVSDVRPESITLNKTSIKLMPGDSEQLTATVVPASQAGSVRWYSNDESIATVKDGLVTAVADNASCRVWAVVGNLRADCVVEAGVRAERPVLSCKTWSASEVWLSWTPQYDVYGYVLLRKPQGGEWGR